MVLPGQYYDQETGLHYNYFRYYDPSTGRYITSDPIGLSGGFNTYTYAANNPLLYFDPLGLYCLSNKEINTITGIIGGSIAGAITYGSYGPWAAIAGALGGAGIGGAFGYTGASSESEAIVQGAGIGVVTGLPSGPSAVLGGALDAGVSNNLSSSGAPPSVALGAGGAVGGYVGASSSAFFSRSAPRFMGAALSNANKLGLRGGLGGLAGGVVSGLINEFLVKNNDCGCE